jgi:large subunit ribosomal protein L19
VSQELLNKAVESSVKKNPPTIRVGDTVEVSVLIVEGDKERIQIFTGTVIRRRGHGIGETFTVRRIVNNEGVERIFPIHSPRVKSVKVIRHGKVRRAKLYFLRDRVGKSTRLKEVKKATAKKKKRTRAKPDTKSRRAKAMEKAEVQSPAETEA